MALTDQIKISDNKIKANQAQYELDRLTAKISTFPSGELRKCVYLNGEDLGYRPSVLEQTKFDYSPLIKIFLKGLDDKADQKEELLKRLKTIEDNNDNQLELFSKANKTSRLAKNESDYNYDNNKFSFCRFHRDFQNLKNRSLKSKYDDISKFYMALDEFKVITAKTKERKTRVMINVVTLYNNYCNFCTKTCDQSALNEKEGRNTNQLKIVDNQLPEWLESKNDFNEAMKLIDDIRIDMNKAKASKDNKKVFNDLSRLITDINNSNVKKEDAAERLKKVFLTRINQDKSKVLFFKIK